MLLGLDFNSAGLRKKIMPDFLLCRALQRVRYLVGKTPEIYHFKAKL